LRRAAGRGATNSRASSGPAASADARHGGLLRNRAEFDAVYRHGRRRSSRQFIVFVAANGLGESRLGMSVGRALGGAVVRNRIRRRVREILRLGRGEIPTGWDIVVHPRASVRTARFSELREELTTLLRNSLGPGSVPSSGEKSKEGPPGAAR